MEKIDCIYLDLDGLLCDFVLGTANFFGLSYDELMANASPGVYDIESFIRCSRDEFFERLENEGGRKFWAELPPYPHALEFYEHCSNIAHTRIFTAPTRDPNSLAGKLDWMYKVFGKGFRNYQISPDKHYSARDDRILIDDLPDNVNLFRRNNGKAILWPTFFNFRHEEADRALEIVKKELVELCESSQQKRYIG